MNYEVIESNYDKFIEINGTKAIKTSLAVQLKENKARYFMIHKNKEFLDDFVIYEDNNWITLDRKYYNDSSLIKNLFSFLKKISYEYITFYIPVFQKEIIDSLKESYDVTLKLVRQGESEFYETKISF